MSNEIQSEPSEMQNDPSVIGMQSIPVEVVKKEFHAKVYRPGHEPFTYTCSDFRISESGGCITLFKRDGKRICIGGNSATIIIEEQ